MPLLLVGLLVLGGCGGGGTPSPALPLVQNAPPEPIQAVARRDISRNRFSLAPGFTPDPAVLRGTAGGDESLMSMLGPMCRGYAVAASETSATLFAQTRFSYLRVMVSGQDAESGAHCDTTLAVVTPSGNVLCNDDHDGFNPVVEGAFEQGLYRVLVGVYSPNRRCDFVLGISENAGFEPSQLPVAGSRNERVR